ncbi:MAG TPA: zinc-binding dehydrogenase [Thermoleophilaceae bacterium]|nr:zinc-binding dehydrogenase [Thermoleophilaceae bacterium]
MLRRFGEPLELAEIEPPRPAPGEALVRVRAVGICATDLKLGSGALPGVELPIVPGHEVAGELVEPAGGLAAGARVACALYDSCEGCDHCRAGRPTLCTEVRRIGIERDGGLAEYLALPERSLIPFGESISFAEAAVTMDAVTTPWRALRVRGALAAGESVAVVGAGGLGLNAIQVALDCGARVAAVEPNEERRRIALELGAELAVPPEEFETVRDWAGQGVDLAFDGSGVRAGFETALATVAAGGRVVCCGYRPGLDYSMDSGRLVLEEITLLGSRAGGPADARAALASVEEGRIAPPIMETLPLERVNDALEALRAGSALGRIVITPGP